MLQQSVPPFVQPMPPRSASARPARSARCARGCPACAGTSRGGSATGGVHEPTVAVAEQARAAGTSNRSVESPFSGGSRRPPRSRHHRLIASAARAPGSRTTRPQRWRLDEQVWTVSSASVAASMPEWTFSDTMSAGACHVRTRCRRPQHEHVASDRTRTPVFAAVPEQDRRRCVRVGGRPFAASGAASPSGSRSTGATRACCRRRTRGTRRADC